MLIMRGLRNIEAVEVATMQISNSLFVRCLDENTLEAEV